MQGEEHVARVWPGLPCWRAGKSSRGAGEMGTEMESELQQEMEGFRAGQGAAVVRGH